MIRRQRLWLIVFVLCVFASGLATGLILSRWVLTPPTGARLGPPPDPPAPAQIVARMRTNLDLTPQQEEQLLRLFEERRPRLAEFQQDVRARFERERQELRSELAKILTPQQLEKFDSIAPLPRGGYR